MVSAALPRIPRPFTTQQMAPLWDSQNFATVGIDNSVDERELTWRMLLAPAEVRAAALPLLGGKQAVAKYWPDFRNYIRLAKVYDETARVIPHVARALLLYYSALQLAKAELLVRRPGVVFNRRVNHGLSFQPERAKSLHGDRLTVVDGVFRELHAARTGVLLPIGTQLAVLDLLRACPDIDYELGLVTGKPSRTTPLAHCVVQDGAEAWSVVALADPSRLIACGATLRALSSTYQLVNHDSRLPGWTTTDVVFQSKWTVPLSNASPGVVISGGPSLAPEDLSTVTRRAADEWRAFAGVPIYGTFYAAPSQRRTSCVPVPPDLARYAAIFYVSSVVRYKPGRLEDAGRTETAWLLETFSSEAGLYLLRAALAGITGTVRVFEEPSRQTQMY